MYIAIDVGATKTLICTLDVSGNIIESIKIKTPKTYSNFLRDLEKTVDTLSTQEFERGCVGLPAVVNRERGIGMHFGNLTWEYVTAQADIEQILSCPMLLENDANLAGLGEVRHINPTPNKALYITVSTGIGSAFVVNGVLDPSTIDAEIGQILLEHNGSLERWESFASGSAIVAKFGKRASEITNQQTWYAIAHNLAGGMLSAIAMYTPDIIIIGGGVGTHLDKFEDKLIELLKIYENPSLSIPKITKAKNPEEAVIYGCLELIKQHESKHIS